MHEDKDGAKFVAILEEVIILANLFLQMHTSGNILFRELTHEYTCQSIDNVIQDILFLHDECKRWAVRLAEARDTFYLLNYFTASQIVTIQLGLEGMNNGKDFNRDTFHLLTLIHEELSQQDIEDAYSRLKYGSSSYQGFTDSINSSLSSRIQSSTVFSEKNAYSLQSIAVFLEYLYKNEKQDKPIPTISLFDGNEPNLIYVNRSNLLISALSLYLRSSCKCVFPSNHEVLNLF